MKMKKFLVDTTALIDFAKGHEPVKSRLLEMIESGEELGVCAINIAEFFDGLPVEKRDQWSEFFDCLLYWNITKNIAIQAGSFKYDFQKKGVQLTTTDTIIAAVAQENKAIVITNNTKDYPMCVTETLK